jgi:hypothetical protein
MTGFFPEDPCCFTGQYVPTFQHLSCSIELDSLHSLEGCDVHPAFHDFLYGQVHVEFDEILDDIRSLIESDTFEYQKFDFVNKLDTPLEITRDGRHIYMPRFRDFSVATRNGFCSELAFKAYKLIRAKYPALDMLFVQGTNSEFSRLGFNHYFLLVGWGLYELRDPNGSRVRARISSNEDVNPWTSSRTIQLDTSYVVDPTERIVTELTRSDYEVKSVNVIAASRWQPPLDIDLDESNAVSYLAMGRARGSGIFIDMRFVLGSTEPRIGVHRPGETVVVKNFDDPALEDLLGCDPTLLDFIVRLRNAFHGGGLKVVD